MHKEVGRASIWEVDLTRRSHRVYASGLRNPNGMGWEPQSGALWTVVNERDELGSDLVPDYMTSVPDGSFFGWPYSYFGQHVDERVKPERPDLVAKAIVPDYALGTHTASLGLAFSEGSALAARFNMGVFVGQHGDGTGCVYQCLGWFCVEYLLTERATCLDFILSDFENVGTGTQGIF